MFFFKECGHSYTKQMEEIFKDINISKQLNDDFQNFLKKRNLYKEKFDIYFTVIHSNSWPFSNSSLPKLMEPVFILFFFGFNESFYSLTPFKIFFLIFIQKNTQGQRYFGNMSLVFASWLDILTLKKWNF